MEEYEVSAEKTAESVSESNNAYLASIQKQRDYTAVIHNTIIQGNRYELAKNAGNSLSVSEQKILLYIISKIRPEDQELKPTSISIKEFCDVCGLGVDARSGTYLKRVKDAITKLGNRVMWLKLDDQGTEVMVHWIINSVVAPQNNLVEVQLDKLLTPYLIGLKENYTTIPLRDVLRFKSKYSFPLYEYLKAYVFQHRPIRISLDELKEILDCTSYTNVTLLRQKVLEPSCSDINSYSELRVNYELVKSGRTYTEIIFTVQNLRISSMAEDQEEMQRRQMLAESELSPQGAISSTLLSAFNIPSPEGKNTEKSEK